LPVPWLKPGRSVGLVVPEGRPGASAASGNEQVPGSRASGCALNIAHVEWIPNYASAIILAAAGVLAVTALAIAVLFLLSRRDWGDEPWAE
jgi:hypothetical protein